MSVSKVFVVAALICFVLAVFQVSFAPMVPLGLALYMVSHLV